MDNNDVKEDNINIINGGDPACYCYFKILKTHNNLDAGIVSITLLSSRGSSFYAYVTDYDSSKIDDAYRNEIQNVIIPEHTSTRLKHWRLDGPLSTVIKQLRTWLNKNYCNNNKIIQFVGDNNPLDFCLLMALLTPDTSYDSIKSSISQVYLDINQDIANMISSRLTDDDNVVPVVVASCIDRKEILKILDIKPINNTVIRDVTTTKKIHEAMKGLIE